MTGYIQKTGLLLLALGFSLASFTAQASTTISVEYIFNRPLISEIQVGGEEYHRLLMEDAPPGGEIGQPALPARGAWILLPYGTDAGDVEIIRGERIFLGDGYRIEPVSQPIPLSLPSDQSRKVALDRTIYDSKDQLPEHNFKRLGTHSFRGYGILVLKLYPVEYIPATGELWYYPHMTVTLQPEHSNSTQALFRGLVDDQNEVLDKIDNSDAVSSYTALAKSVQNGFDLLIITIPALADAFVPLKEHHDSTGILTEIMTTDDIGTTDPDGVRMFIKDSYLNNGINYVLIGGDDDIIPAKDLYVASWEGVVHGDDPYYVYDMPADIYFGCLDGTYNGDRDSRWGEPEDGSGGGDVDLIAEVYVGRALVDNVEEVDRFVRKTIAYLVEESDCPEKVLITAERLGFGGPVEFGGVYMNEVIDGSSHHGYTTFGIPSDEYDIQTLYDMDWPGNDWPATEAVSRLNSCFHIVAHLGHSNYEWSMKMHSSALVPWLTNDNYFFLYNWGCMAGQFDHPDCWAEYVTGNNDHGAFAGIMNARYGWGTSRTTVQTTDSPNHRFNREFWDALFNPEESKRELGRANQDSKEDNLYRIDEPAMRWCYYQLNLFGDPTVALKSSGWCSDADSDGVCSDIDLCPEAYDPDQLDSDGDGTGDACDNCPEKVNTAQKDIDIDGIGDRCDTCTDCDGDGYGDPGHSANTCEGDNCPNLFNPDQEPRQRGDVDCEYGVNVLDVLHVVNHILGIVPVAGQPLDRADCNGDGEVNVLDTVGLVNVILGLGGCQP